MVKDSFEDIAEDLQESLDVQASKTALPAQGRHWYLAVPKSVRFLAWSISLASFIFGLVCFLSIVSSLKKGDNMAAFLGGGAGFGFLQPYFQLRRARREALPGQRDLI